MALELFKLLADGNMRAFTLVEVLLYIALLTFMFTGMFSSAAALHDSMRYTHKKAATLETSLMEQDRADLGFHRIP